MLYVCEHLKDRNLIRQAKLIDLFVCFVDRLGFTTDKPPNFKEVPIFEATDTIDGDNAQSNGMASMKSIGAPMPGNDTIKTHLYVPNLTKVSMNLNFVSCFMCYVC